MESGRNVAEMNTGEGKTTATVPVYLNAQRQGHGYY